MKYFKFPVAISLLGMAFLLAGKSKATDYQLSERTAVAILVTEPGGTVGSAWGHCALMFYDSAQKTTFVFEYLSSETSPKLSNLWTYYGREIYQIGISSLEQFRKADNGRNMLTLPVDIPSSSVQALFDTLVVDHRSGFLFSYRMAERNCCSIIPERLSFYTTASKGLSVREHLRKEGNLSSAIELLFVDILISSYADKPLKNGMPITPAHVAQTMGHGEYKVNSLSGYLLVLFSVVLSFGLLSMITPDYGRILFLLVNGLIGTVIVSGNLFSHDPLIYGNHQWMLFFPPHLIAVFLGRKAQQLSLYSFIPAMIISILVSSYHGHVFFIHLFLQGTLLVLTFMISNGHGFFSNVKSIIR